ncbi:MAG: AtpZ/AtpI family protein [Pirellulales bacterium]|nr:AtpZ/AtpI family protein [Pirellulales bacterium]
MPVPGKRSSAYAEAAAWLGRIGAMAVVMVLPAVLGRRLDTWLGTCFLAPIGIIIGVTYGFVYLLAITGVFRRPPESKEKNNGPPPENME